jgi:hypothetical protein
VIGVRGNTRPRLFEIVWRDGDAIAACLAQRDGAEVS